MTFLTILFCFIQCYVITNIIYTTPLQSMNYIVISFAEMSYRGNRGYPHPQGGVYGNESLEEENEYLEGELKGKISALKSLSIDIGTEVKEHNKFLKEMDDQFDSTHSMFSNTIGKVLRLAKSNHKYYIYYLLAFCMFVFLVLWIYIR